MNGKSKFSTRIGRRRAALLLFASLLSLLVGTAAAQIRQPGGFSSESAEGTPIARDYFARDFDSATKAVVNVTERYHLSEENFWQKYREGNVNAARQDLLFILRYIPNHPKVLHLLAFDPKVKQDATDVVWHFERAIRAFPRSAYTYAQYGRYLIRDGRRESGVALLDRALSLDPNLLLAQAWRAEAMGADSTRAAH